MRRRWLWRVLLGGLAGVVVLALAAVLWPASDAGYAWRPPGGELRDAALRVRVVEPTAAAEPRTIVLLHGLAGSNRYFGAELDALAATGRVVVPDLLGFGGSPRPADSQYDAAAHADAVRETLRELGVEGPVVLVGHSAGALVAFELAATWPEAVRGVVAFGPPLYERTEQARERISGLGLHVRLFAMDGSLAEWLCETFHSHRELAVDLFASLRRELPRAIAADAMRHTWTSYSNTLTNLIFAADSIADVAAVRVPVLLVVGDADPIVDQEVLASLARRLPHVRLEIWQGDHELPLSDTDRAVRTIEAFVREATRIR